MSLIVDEVGGCLEWYFKWVKKKKLLKCERKLPNIPTNNLTLPNHFCKSLLFFFIVIYQGKTEYIIYIITDIIGNFGINLR